MLIEFEKCYSRVTLKKVLRLRLFKESHLIINVGNFFLSDVLGVTVIQQTQGAFFTLHSGLN